MEGASRPLGAAGHTVSGRVHEGGLRAVQQEDTRTLFGSDFVVVLKGRKGCPESETDVLTAHGAGIPRGTVDDALAAT